MRGFDGDAPFAGVGQQHELLGVRHREGAQHDGIDQAENRRIGADAQAEGEHGDEQESGAFPEGAAC